MTRQITASRMTVLLSTALTLLASGFNFRGLWAEEPPPSASAVDASSRVAEETPDLIPPRPKVELTVRVLELDESLITDGESPLWKLVPWDEVVENRLKSIGHEYTTFYPHLTVPAGHRSIYTSYRDVIQQQVQKGASRLSFTLSQQDVSRFIEDVVASKQGSIKSESNNVIDSGNSPTFQLAHHPLSVRQPVLAQPTRSSVNRLFKVTPFTYHEGTHLMILSRLEITSTFSTGWNWLDRKLPPARSVVFPAPGLSVFVPRDEALVVFSLGNGSDHMQPGQPSMLIVTPQLRDGEIPTATAAVLPPPPQLPTVKSSSTPNSSRDTITLAAADDSKPGRSRQRNLAELTALREDVRGLRDDVRRLSELLEQRLAIRDRDQPAVHPTAALPDQKAVTDINEGMLFFTAKWCGPCQQMQPMIAKLVGEGLPIRSVDVDQSAGLASQFNVTSIPCFVLLEKGKEIDRVTGLADERQLRSLLKRVAPVAAEAHVELSLIEGQTVRQAFLRPAGVIDPNKSDLLAITRLTSTDYLFQARQAGEVTLQVLYVGDAKPTPIRVRIKPNPTVDTESELSLSLAEKPLPPITMQVGQRSELLFARRIRTVEKESDATLSLIRVSGNAVMVQGKVAGVTVLQVSLDESQDVLDVIVQVTASESQAAPPKVVTFDGTKSMPQSVIVPVGSSVEAGFDDWLTRVDGFDPKLINVTATDKVRLRLEGVSEGKTSLKVTKRNGEAAFEVTVVPTPDQAAARLPVVTHRIAGTETLSRLVTLIEGTNRRMKTQQPTPRISIGDAQVVDVIQESPTSQRLRGLKPGMTTMTFWLAGASEPEPVVVTIRVLPREAAAQSQAVKKEAEEVKNTALDPKANALNFGGVTPRNIAQEAEEELLGLPKSEEPPR